MRDGTVRPSVRSLAVSPLVVWVVVLAACENAVVRSRADGAMADAGADATSDDAHVEDVRDAADDGARDAADSAPQDSGPEAGPDLGVAPPAYPTPPDGPPAMLGVWLDGTDADSIAVADPGVGRPGPPDFGACGPWYGPLDAGDGARVCEPWPESGRLTCGAGTAHFPGGSACERVGAACPAADRWAIDLPTAGVVLRVLPSAGAGGVGTAASPFATIAEALVAAASTGSPAVIALAPGTYAGPITLPANVTLWGACAAGTVVTAGSDEVAIETNAMGASVRSLTVRGGMRGIAGHADATLSIENVVIEDAVEGIAANPGSIVDARGVLVTSTAPGAVGVRADAATLTVERAVLRDLQDEGAAAFGAGALLTLRNVACSDVRAGVAAHDHAEVVLDGVVVDRAANAGIFGGEGARIRGSHVVARDTGYGGIDVYQALELDLDGVLVERSHGTGIRNQTGSTPGTTLRDTIIRDVDRAVDFDVHGVGIAIWRGTATLDRVRVERTAGNGLMIWENANVTAMDVDVRESGRVTPGVWQGIGIQVTDRAHLVMTRGSVSGAVGAGIVVGGCVYNCGSAGRMGLATIATLADVVVRDARMNAGSPLTGEGIVVLGEANAQITRALIEQTEGPAIGVRGVPGIPGIPDSEVLPGVAGVNDVVVRGSGAVPRGIVVADGAELTGRNVLVAGVRGSGLEARGAGTVASLEEVVVADVAAIAGDDDARGTGVAAQDGATLAMGSAVVLRAADACMRATSGATLDVTDAEAESCARGAAATDATMTLERVSITRSTSAGIDASGATTMVSLVDVALAAGAGDPGSVALRALAGARVALTAVRVDGAFARGVLASDRDTMISGGSLTVVGTGEAGWLLAALGDGDVALGRVALDAASGFAAGAFGMGSSLALTDVSITRTRAGACQAGECAIDVGAYDRASVSVERFRLEDGDGIGVQVTPLSTVALRAGSVQGAVVGVELPAGTEPDTVLTDVAFDECAIEISTDASTQPTRPERL